MRAAAELDGEFPPVRFGGVVQQIGHGCADGNDPHHRRIFFAEDGPQAVDLQRFFLRGFLGVNGKFFGDGFIDQFFDAGDFVIAHGFGMGEVEAEFFGIDERAFLLDAFAEGFAKGPVGEVGAGVVFFGAAARWEKPWR